MTFTFENYNTSEIKWNLSSELKKFEDQGKNKWTFKSHYLKNVTHDYSNKDLLLYSLSIQRNNVNSVLMFILMPTIIITAFNIVCYLLPVGGKIILNSIIIFHNNEC